MMEECGFGSLKRYFSLFWNGLADFKPNEAELFVAETVEEA